MHDAGDAFIGGRDIQRSFAAKRQCAIAVQRRVKLAAAPVCQEILSPCLERHHGLLDLRKENRRAFRVGDACARQHNFDLCAWRIHLDHAICQRAAYNISSGRVDQDTAFAHRRARAFDGDGITQDNRGRAGGFNDWRRFYCCADFLRCAHSLGTAHRLRNIHRFGGADGFPCNNFCGNGFCRHRALSGCCRDSASDCHTTGDDGEDNEQGNRPE